MTDSTDLSGGVAPLASAASGWAERIVALADADGLGDAPTPLLAIDLDTLEGNVARMAATFADRPGGVRPHVKTHKSTAIAQLQVAAHGCGLTCSTTDEVTAMVAAGIDDVLLANVVSDPARLRALASAARSATVTAAADSLAVVALLAREARAADVELGVVIERDIGMGRNGVTSTADGLRVAEAVAAEPHLALRGVMAYEGHLVDIEDRGERRRRSLHDMEAALELFAAVRADGHDAPIFTGSSTATYDATGLLPEMTDVQAGTYVLMDEVYHRLTPEFEPALAVVATVLTSRPDGTLVLDAGAKRLGVDWGVPLLVGFEAEHRYTAEEHTVFGLRDGRRPRVGERLAMLPGHACTTMSLHAVAHACRDGAVERPFAIDARDCVA